MKELLKRPNADLRSACPLMQSSALATYRTDNSLDISPLPRRLRCAVHFLDVHGGDLFTKCLAVNLVSITQQIFRCSVKRKSFHDLRAVHSAVGCAVTLKCTSR